MSMTFDRVHLILVSKKALARHEKVFRDYQDEVQKVKISHSAAHTEKSREKAIRLRDTVTKLLKRSGPIHYSDVIETLGSPISEIFYRPPLDSFIRQQVTKPTGLLTRAEVSDIKTLIEVLESTIGTTLTVNELRLLGLKDLGTIFTAAAGEVSEKARKAR